MNDQYEYPEATQPAQRKLRFIFLLVQGIIILSTTLLLITAGNYGWTLFFVVPLSIGITIGSYSRRRKTIRFVRDASILLLVLSVLSLLLLAAGAEGAICVLMAVGVICLPALAGLGIGYLIRRSLQLMSLGLILLLTSSAFVYDTHTDEEVRSTASINMRINATPARIWQVMSHPVAFGASGNWFLRSGVSYPQAMALYNAKDNGCILHVRYSNGEADFPVSLRDSLRCLRFDLSEPILTMKELSWTKVDAPHLKGYFNPAFGEFRIKPQLDGSCLLTATTSYSYRIRPAFYWRWWCDYLANATHRHVLERIRAEAER